MLLIHYYYPVQSLFRVTWFSMYYPLVLKRILSSYLDYPMMHFISTGSNSFHDDNVPLHKAQVVTECFE